MAIAPLADRMRPQSLDDMVGQTHLLGEGKALRGIIESGRIPNMIFYGPSGVGKTTLASIIAQRTDMRLHRLNGTTASTADIRAVAEEVGTLAGAGGILLYLDEIQYFNKKQQQTLLEHIENGNITLIASTTENPYFYVYNAILSRSTIFEFKPVQPEDVARAVRRAFSRCAKELHKKIALEEGVCDHIAAACGGDVRKAMNTVELLCAASPEKDGTMTVSLEDTKALTQRSASRYDRDGDSHYDILSAFHKSLRGSDPDAALHYLARLLEGGDMASACRRMLCAVSEDVGMAYPQAITIVKACCDSALQLGLPEARLPLAQAALVIATSPKSNSACCAIDAALADIKNGRSGDIPAHLKDSHYGGAAKMGRGLTYQYPHNFPGNYVKQEYLPAELQGTHYYQPGQNKTEQQTAEYWARVKQEKR